jgi:hypothetical protein
VNRFARGKRRPDGCCRRSAGGTERGLFGGRLFLCARRGLIGRFDAGRRSGRLAFGRGFGRGRGRSFGGGLLFFRSGFRDLESIQPAQLNRHVLVDGAGVRLLLGDSQFGEPIENLVSLDFELASQLVDANLFHS